MFELSVACKYLIPRRRQLSVSIISLISILVIALVVWLIVVFFSVTDGLEKSWVNKLTALTAPIRVTPSEAYYHSYYYQIDSVSEASGYSHKTIREKQETLTADPYDPDVDEEIPAYWPDPDQNAEGSLKDLVKLVYTSIDDIQNVPGLHARDFELTATHIRLRLLRQTPIFHSQNVYGGTTQSALAYPAYLGNFEVNNPRLEQTLLPIEERDLNNFLQLMGLANNESSEDLDGTDKTFFRASVVQRRLKDFFDVVTINRLKARSFGWTIPRRLLPSHAKWEAFAIQRENQVIRLILPQKSQHLSILQKELEEQGLNVIPSQVIIQEGVVTFQLPQQAPQEFSSRFPLTLVGGSELSAQLDKSSLGKIQRIEDLHFAVKVPIQGTLLRGKVPYRGLEIAAADILKSSDTENTFPVWVHRTNQSNASISFVLPKDPDVGDGIVLPKSFRDAGVMMGDRGSLSYLAPTPSMLQEQQLPIYVAGFYDPGIIPIGGKFILASDEITSLIRASHQVDDKTAMTNGINVRFDRLDQTEHVKAQLQQAFKNKGINRYWTVETYHEYEFTKEMMQELQSQKNLFMLIAVVIIIVACSNIISMLVILVNDKKLEIGILRSMGASSQSIAFIFGLAGALIGVLGSLTGIAAAIVTLHHLDGLVWLLSRLQGHDMFSTHLYGQILPSELSYQALTFVLAATVGISLLAGIVPAIKACLLRPSHILRSNGG